MAKQQGPGSGSLNKDRRVQAEKHPPNKGRQMNQGRLQTNRRSEEHTSELQSLS